MANWKIFVTFFKKLYDDHYSPDRTYDPSRFTFVKVNDAYPAELEENRLTYDVLFEHDFPVFRPDLQEKGYHENSVLYHLHRNGFHRAYDYVGFAEYDHVLCGDFTRRIQEKVDAARQETIFVFNKFTFRQLWEQGILMDPARPDKETGNPESKWNCLNVILKDYNDFFGTAYGIGDLASRNCFPICHNFLIPSAMFEKIMAFHGHIMDSGKVERYHRHNWRARAGLMERYMAVELALEKAPIDDTILLEHRSYPIKVLKPEWFKPGLRQKILSYLQKKM